MLTRPPDHRSRLRDVARPQLGLFTREQALECGFSPRALASSVERGDFRPVFFNGSRLRGVYCFAGIADSWPVAVLAACLAVGDGAVACRDTALQVHGLRPADSAVVHVCSPTRWQPAVPGIVVHTTRDLIAGDWTTIGAIPVATVARTVIDMAETLDSPGRLALVDEVVFGGWAARRWLYRRAMALHQGRTGVQDVIRATAPGAEAEFRSWLERQANLAYRRLGVPPPAWNVPVNDAKGRIGIVDCLWPCGLVVEIEGLRFHTTPAQRRRDAARFNRLARRGAVLRYTWQDVVERPEAMCDEILDVLGAVDLVPGR